MSAKYECEICSTLCNEKNAVMVSPVHSVSSHVDNTQEIEIVRWEIDAAHYFGHVHVGNCLTKWLAIELPKLRAG